MARSADDYQVLQPYTLKELSAADAAYQERVDDFDLFQASAAAFREQNTLATVFNNTLGYAPDPEFELTVPVLEELTEGLPQERWDIFEDSVSLEHARALRERTLQSIKDREVLSSYGWTGIGLEFASAMVDLPAIAGTIATEGALGPAIWGAKATRLGRAFRTAATAGVASAGVESYLVAQNPNKDAYDILFAAGGGFLLGGAVGSTRLGVRKEDIAKREAMKEAAVKLQRDAHQGQIAETAEAMRRQGIDPGIEVPANPLEETGPFTLRSNAADLEESKEGAAFATWGPIRWDARAITGGSEVAAVRDFSETHLEDAVNPGRPTTDLKARVMRDKYNGEFYKIYPNEFHEFAKARGYAAVERNFFPEKARREFGTEVSRHVERETSTDPNVIKAANRVRKIFAELRTAAQKAGVLGFENIPEDYRYFTHIWDGNKFMDVGGDVATRLLTKSLLSANPDMTEDFAAKLAKGMTKKIMRREVGIDADLAKIFSASDKDTLRQILLDEFEDLELFADDVDRMISQLDIDREGLPPRAKRRLSIDMATKEVINGKVYSIEDLMERDAEKVVGAYINQMSGRIAFAENGVKSDGDFKSFVKDAIEIARQKGLDTEKFKSREIKTLEIMYALINGRPRPDIADPASTSMRFLRLFLDYNFIRYMGQVGIAQVAELGNAVSIDGVSGLVRQLPELRNIMRRAADGELEDSVSRDLEQFASVGLDSVLQRHLDRVQYEDTFNLQPGRGGVQRAIETARGAIAPLRNFTANFSGLVPITVFLERTTARIAAQTIVDLATGVKKGGLKRVISKGTYEDDVRRRLQMLGLDDDMTKKVFDSINEHAVLVPSEFGKKRRLRALNMKDWDEDAANAFGLAIARWTRQAIQKNDFGNLHPFMTRPMGQLLLQFRSFMIVSYSKQFLHNIKRSDYAAYQAMMMSVIFGSLGYVAQTQINSIGRGDKEEFLKERLLDDEGNLDLLKIGRQGFARSSWASLFPGAVDTLFAFGKYDKPFGYGRTSGLGSDFVTGTLPITTLDQLGKSIQGVASLSGIGNSEYQFSRAEARAIRSLMPLQNAFIIRNVLDKMVEAAPETSKVR